MGGNNPPSAADRGFSCQVIVPNDIRHAVSDTQLQPNTAGQAAQQSSIQYLPWAELIRRSFEVDAVVLAIQGPHVSRFMHDLFDAVAASGAHAHR